jgi:hypothetical protein
MPRGAANAMPREIRISLEAMLLSTPLNILIINAVLQALPFGQGVWCKFHFT